MDSSLSPHGPELTVLGLATIVFEADAQPHDLSLLAPLEGQPVQCVWLPS